MLKHKDEIRRRLTIAEVPEPPADLVQKIKHDIPKHFSSMTAKEVEKKPREASPLWNFWGMSWQLAASILVLVGLTWAVFEAWQSELNEAVRVADAEQKVISVDEFEKRVTAEPDVVHVEGAAPVTPERRQTDAAKKDQASAAPAATSAFAPDRPSETQAERDDVASATKARTAEPAPALTAATREESEVGRTTAVPEAASRSTENAPSMLRESRQPAAPAAEESGLADVALPRRDVVVPGLSSERIVKAVLEIDSTGKVIEVRLPDGTARLVIDAVNEEAKTWTFATGSMSGTRGSFEQTVEVKLRKRD